MLSQREPVITVNQLARGNTDSIVVVGFLKTAKELAFVLIAIACQRTLRRYRRAQRAGHLRAELLLGGEQRIRFADQGIILDGFLNGFP